MAHALSGSLGGSRRAAGSHRPWVKGLLVAIGVAALLLIGWSVWDRDLISKWTHTAQPLPFFTGMALLPALGFPVSPLFVLAGATFGRRVGLAGSAIALVANLALCYWIARSGLRPWLVRLLRRFDYELPNFENKSKGSWRFALLVKAAPAIPQFVKNYGLGVAGVPFSIYLVSSLLISGAYGAALILLGESLFQHEISRSTLVAGAVVVLAGAIWWLLRKRRASAANE